MEEEEKYDNLQFTEQPVEYTDDNIRHLDDMEHIRVRSGMYIGRLGDGSQSDDGIYVLLKEVMDNSIDEFKMGAGKKIEVTIEDNLRVSVRDYGRGIPQGKLPERCGYQGGERLEQPFRSMQLSRRQSTQGCI